jgi:hypothetical protein
MPKITRKPMADIFEGQNEPDTEYQAYSDKKSDCRAISVENSLCLECGGAGIVHRKFGDVKTCQTCLKNGRWSF